MSTDDSAEKICRRMAELRREMDCDVREVSRGARVMTDWKFYARKFPWALVGVAAVAGFLLVPKRKAVIKPDPETIAELVKQKKIRVETVTPDPNKPGMVKSLLLMGLTWAARAGAQYVTQQMAAAAQNKARGAAHPEHSPGPSPLEEPWSPTPTGEQHAREPR
jgi:signal recognition particle subunit SEC65